MLSGGTCVSSVPAVTIDLCTSQHCSALAAGVITAMHLLRVVLTTRSAKSNVYSGRAAAALVLNTRFVTQCLGGQLGAHPYARLSTWCMRLGPCACVSRTLPTQPPEPATMLSAGVRSPCGHARRGRSATPPSLPSTACSAATSEVELLGKRQRLERILSNLGYCTRKDARRFLRTNDVQVSQVRTQDPALKVRCSGRDADTSVATVGPPEALATPLHCKLQGGLEIATQQLYSRCAQPQNT